jgi:hypothetical protein
MFYGWLGHPGLHHTTLLSTKNLVKLYLSKLVAPNSKFNNPIQSQGQNSCLTITAVGINMDRSQALMWKYDMLGS